MGRISTNRLMIKHKGKNRGRITVLVIVLVSLAPKVTALSMALYPRPTPIHREALDT